MLFVESLQYTMYLFTHNMHTRCNDAPQIDEQILYLSHLQDPKK